MWLRRVLCVLSLLYALGQANDADSRLVDTAQGPVRGYRDPEGDLFVFYNIPYATAPTGKDRFKAPLPGPLWISPLEAVSRPVICPQADMMNWTMGKIMQESCLIANVYMPDTTEKNLPVLVIVHGGAYQMGYGDMFTPKQMVKSKKIIAVTFNYRLGIHGFLCLGTPGAPGNAGMKDQVALLRWVKRNIASFGGNPNEVTIEGYSAGSSAVDLLVLSKAAKGLFHRAIPESGSNLATWSVQVDPLANAQEYAKQQHFNNVNDIYALEEFYTTAPYELLLRDTFLLRKYSDFVFSPCVERDTGVERFLDDYPVNILRKGEYNKVPMLYGFANMEGLFRVNFGYDVFKNGMNEKFSDFLPRDLQFENEEEKEKVAKEIKDFYFGDKTIGEETILNYIDFFTDVIFAYSTLRSLKMQVQAGNENIFLYEYSYVVDGGMPLPHGINVKGADHCAQSNAVFDGMYPNPNKEETDIPEDFKKMKAIVREYWLNFITNGTPALKDSVLPAWPAAGADCSPYMELTLTPQLRGQLLPLRTRFWDDIYERHYRPPVSPPAPPTKHYEL